MSKIQEDKRGPGRPPGTHPPPRWVERLTVKLPEGGKAMVKRLAKDHGIGVSEHVRRLLGLQGDDS